ncbi:hypothetical protein SLEP1_g39404 [Rubroshorea leprosula]|uniref:Secreted protein n=1 Tax=Rubroshorea leprosula TaxID=152421 RepID=A0AAV5L038_9ROSI|nr:hypothetical protein SLEP1_g39404 [Rubroshorea leprosula]
MMVLDRGNSLLFFLIVILLQIRSAVGLNSTAGDHEVRKRRREKGLLQMERSSGSRATGHIIELILQDCSLRIKRWTSSQSVREPHKSATP